MKTIPIILRPFRLICFFIFAYLPVEAQFTAGGEPASFAAGIQYEACDSRRLSPPDAQVLSKEDAVDEALGLPVRVASLIPAGFSIENSGSWRWLGQGGRIWRLRIACRDANALGLYFSEFYLPEDSRLFVYNSDCSRVLGAFTYLNNQESGLFAIEPLPGEELTIEYFEPERLVDRPVISISEVAYVYRGYDGRGFGDSGPCEVNINCSPEGDEWQEVKKGVVRIQCRVGGAAFWCSGSLINNARLDKTPYLLTADHCAFKFQQYATQDDLNQWIFYFNFEGPGCDNPSQSPTPVSLVGATKVASGGDHGNDGSDFFFLRLNQLIPASYDAYFNGWTITEEPPSNLGVTIHHPEGDIKKISFYNTSLTTASWQGNGLNSHWKVYWAGTGNGFGVTEPGSSGCPLFDSQGRIIGTLTGGQASCTNNTLPDYYGKFSYHWASNGEDDTLKLKPWLDPDNTGIESLGGIPLSLTEPVEDGSGQVYIYPNPAKDRIFVSLGNPDPTEISVVLTDARGALLINETDIISMDSQEIELDLGELSDGLYLLRIVSDNNVSLHKLVLKK